MSWILIVTTLVSLFGGAGAVYAADDAVPGDILYPVKTLVEDARLLLADEEADVDLLLEFLDERLAEIGILLDEGDLEDLSAAFSGYENRAQQLGQLMSRIQPEDPLAGDALQTMLQSRLQEQAELMQGMANAAGDLLQVRERLQDMLQTNEQLRKRDAVQEDADTTKESGQEQQGEKPGEDQGQPQDKGQPQGAAQGQDNQTTQWQASLEAQTLTEDGQFVLTFRVHAALKGSTYMKVNGVEYACSIADAAQGMLTCRGPAPSAEEVQVELFEAGSGRLLYSSILRMKRYGQDAEKGQSDEGSDEGGHDSGMGNGKK